MSLLLKSLNFIKIAAFMIFSAACLILFLVSLLLFTHTGNQFTISIAQTIEPRLSIELKQGSLFNSPTFSKIGWLDQDTKIQIAAASYAFDWSCLFTKVCLQRLDISNANIVIESSDSEAVKETEAETANNFVSALPIDIAIQAVNLKNIHVKFGDILVDLDSLHLQAEGKKKDISLTSVIDGLTVKLPAKAEATMKTSPDNKKIPTSLPALLSQHDLPEINLPLNLSVAPFKITDFTLEQGTKTLLAVNSLNTHFNFMDSQLTIQSLILDIPETDLQLAGEINFSGNYPLNMQLKGQLKSIKQLQPAHLLAEQVYDLKSTGDLSKLKTELLLSNKISMQLTAQVDLLEKNLPHSLTLHWQKLRWPLTGKAQYSSATGSLHSRGVLNDYRINLDSVYNIENIPAGEVNLNGQGNLQQFKLKQFLINILDGTAELSGLLKWQDAIRWDGQLAVDKIDLAKLNTQYSGNFSGVIKQNLEVKLDQHKTPSWMVNIPEMDIHGQFLTRPFAVDGIISADNKKGISFQDVIVNNAENEFIINGLLAEQNDLDIKLNIVDLSHTLLGSSGTIGGELKILGSKDALKVKSNLQGALLTYETTQLDAFQLDSEAVITDKPMLALQFSAKKLTVAKQVIDTIDINIQNIRSSASAKEHQVDVAVNSELLSTELTIQLVQEHNSWLSALHAATIYFSEQQLILQKPVDVVFEKDNLLLSPHCWRLSSPHHTDGGKFCAKNLNIGKQGEADFVIDSYLLANLDPFLPEEFKMAGAVSADARIKWNETDKPLIDVNVLSQDLLVKVNLDNTADGVVTYPVETFNIKLLSNKDESDFSAIIHSPDLLDAKIQGQLSAYKIKPDVNASIDIELPDFSPFAVLIPELEKLTGYSNTALTINGPLHKPIINGQVNIQDTSVTAVGAPVQINRLNTVIAIKNNRASIDGVFYTSDFDANGKLESERSATLIQDAIGIVDSSIQTVGRTIRKDKKVTNEKASVEYQAVPGRANIKGTFDWQDKLQGDIYFFANQMAIYDYEKIDLLVSPDLHVTISQQVELTGKIVVNKGRIRIKELPEEAISPSADVIVVDMETPKDASTLPIRIDLQVDLGQRLKVQALGLDTKVRGNLLIRKAIEKSPTIHGELNLIDGSYTAFGQQLVLRKSRVIFQGPAEARYLSLEAIRDPNKTEDNVTAGVRVTGPPDELELVVFSDPAMAQQEALSYILSGKSLQNSSDSEGNSQIASMLINLGAGTSAPVLNKIGKKLGIEDLSLSASGSGDEQSIGVSGYIAPKVELSYGVGVFDNFSILAIRYEMFERFYIEASSGLYQAIDAYYEFDWD